MTNEQNSALHADDGEIVRWIDGALGSGERAALEAHTARCPQCSARRDVFARRTRRLSEMLAAIDVQVPIGTFRLSVTSRVTSRPAYVLRIPVRWRVAAVLALLLGGAAAVPPVRAWIVEIARSAWTAATHGN